MTTEGLSLATRARRAVGRVRVRVVVGYVLLLASALAVTVIVVRQVLLTRLDRQIERALAQEVAELRRLVDGIDPATGQPFGSDVIAIFDTFLARNVPGDGEAFYTIVQGEPHLTSFGAPADLLLDARLVAEWTSATTPVRSTITVPAGEARTVAVPLLDQGQVRGVFIVAFFPADEREEVLQAVRIIAWAGLGVLVVASVVAWSLAGRVLRPVSRLTSTARQISESDLSARIPVEGHDELAELGATFNAMLDRLESGFRTQRQFLDDVAHEMRTPITIVRGHLEVLGDDPDERQETVALVTDELDRMSRYVSDLLLLAKAEQPDLLHLQPVDLGELAESLMQKAAALDQRCWVLDEAPTPGRMAILADPDRLTQAMVNLATNAVQHTTPDDEIGLGIRAVPGGVELWVRDSGSGIDPEVRDRLFTRTSRGAASRISRPDGTGLGLSIVAAIAAAHGGRVRVAADARPGATVVITIPTTPEEHE